MLNITPDAKESDEVITFFIFLNLKNIISVPSTVENPAKKVRKKL